MRGGLAPPLPPEAAPAVSLRAALALAAAATLTSALFWSPLLLGGPLSGHDWSSHHYHYFDWVRTSLVAYHTIPLYMSDAWITPNFLANAESPTLGPLAPLLAVLSTGAYIKLLIVLFCAVGLAGGFQLQRDLGAGPAVAALLAIVYAFGGFFASHIGVGHHWAMGAWLLPLLLLLYRRAVLGSVAALLAAALLDACTILGGQHQPFIWQNLFLLALALLWCARARSLTPLTRFAAMAGLGAALAAVKLVPLWLEFSDYAPSARIAGLPPASLAYTLVAWGQGPGRRDPALHYAWGAGWWEYAFYVGPLALAALVAGGAASGRRAWPALALAAAFLLLALEPPPVWSLLADLPLLRSQRCPSRFLVLALFAAVLAAGPGLERLRRAAAERWPRGGRAAAWALVLVVGVDLGAQSLPWQRAARGPAIESADHRPRPLAVSGPGGARAVLSEFAPNRLVYRVEAGAPSRLVLPLRFGKRGAEWSAGPLRPLDREGRLELEVPAGERDVALEYRPPGLVAGAALSGVAFAGCVALALRRRRRTG